MAGADTGIFDVSHTEYRDIDKKWEEAEEVFGAGDLEKSGESIFQTTCRYKKDC